MSKSALTGSLVALLGVSVLGVGTPYQEEKKFEVEPSKLVGAESLRLKLELPRVNLRISARDGFLLEADAEGFGSPGSRLEDNFKPPEREGGQLTVSLRQKASGFFATAEQSMTLHLPRELRVDADLAVGKGVVVIELAADSEGFWDFELGDVDLRVIVPEGLALKFEYAEGLEVDAQNAVSGLEFDSKKRRWKIGDEPAVKMRLKTMGGGNLYFEGVE